MKKAIVLLSFIVFSIFSAPLMAQKVISDFSLKNTVDGSTFNLKSYADKKAVVVIFTSNYCPFSKLYEARIKAFAESYASKGIAVVLINSNKHEENPIESEVEMAKKAEEDGFAYPYLADKDQKIMQLFGASKTPEVFLLKPGANGFTLLYSGAIDDNPQVESDVRERYLKDAVEAVLGGRNPTRATVRATGCIIKT
jgi:peroxiredoxin